MSKIRSKVSCALELQSDLLRLGACCTSSSRTFHQTTESPAAAFPSSPLFQYSTFLLHLVSLSSLSPPSHPSPATPPPPLFPSCFSSTESPAAPPPLLHCSTSYRFRGGGLPLNLFSPPTTAPSALFSYCSLLLPLLLPFLSIPPLSLLSHPPVASPLTLLLFCLRLLHFLNTTTATLETEEENT